MHVFGHAGAVDVQQQGLAHCLGGGKRDAGQIFAHHKVKASPKLARFSKWRTQASFGQSAVKLLGSLGELLLALPIQVASRAAVLVKQGSRHGVQGAPQQQVNAVEPKMRGLAIGQKLGHASHLEQRIVGHAHQQGNPRGKMPFRGAHYAQRPLDPLPLAQLVLGTAKGAASLQLGRGGKLAEHRSGWLAGDVVIVILPAHRLHRAPAFALFRVTPSRG